MAKKIIVNGKSVEWAEVAINARQLAEIAKQHEPSITYRNGPGGSKGILGPEYAITVHEGMVFNVVNTGGA